MVFPTSQPELNNIRLTSNVCSSSESKTTAPRRTAGNDHGQLLQL